MKLIEELCGLCYVHPQLLLLPVETESHAYLGRRRQTGQSLLFII